LQVTEDFEDSKVVSRGFGILDVGYQTENDAWAVGGSGSLFFSTDGGKVSSHFYSFLAHDKGMLR
jgi:photosystem II stability/assembly factor-like uncharacterized protein